MGKRGPQPILTERDKVVLVDLYKTRCMTGTQLQQSAFGEVSRYSRSRLKSLRERDIIQYKTYTPKEHDSTHSFGAKAKKQFVYELTDKGVHEAEMILQSLILSQSKDITGCAERLKVQTGSIARYLQVANIYLQNKDSVEWMPHFVLRDYLNAPDFTIACLAAVKLHDKMGLIYGVTSSATTKSYSLIAHQTKDAARYGISKTIILCPSDKTAKAAIEYFITKEFEGDVYVLTYEAAQEQLPFVMGSGKQNVLVEAIQSVYGQVSLQQSFGRHPAAFGTMIEHRPGKWAYLTDLTTGSLTQLYEVVRYDEAEDLQHKKFNDSRRGVWAIVRNREQLEAIAPYLSNHPHVRIFIEDSAEWYGCDSGKWVKIRVTAA